MNKLEPIPTKKIAINMFIGELPKEAAEYLYNNCSKEIKDKIDEYIEFSKEHGNLYLMRERSIYQQAVWDTFCCANVTLREDKTLIETIEKYKDVIKDIKIVEIPEDVDYFIYQGEDGHEMVIDKNRCWS